MKRTDDLSLGIRSYKKRVKINFGILGILFILLVFFFILDISLGSKEMSFLDTLKALFNMGDKSNIMTIYQLRMPRALGALLCGAGLGISGAIMQSSLRNPLASPSTIGISSAATFGANVAIIGLGAGVITGGQTANPTLNNPYLVTICAFAFALGAVFLIMLISKFQNFSPESIILAGTALSALFGAGTTILQYYGDETKIAAAIFWTFGDLNDIYYDELLLIFIVFIICFIFFILNSWNYNALASGEEAAKSLGLKTGLVRALSLIFSTLLTAIIVSFVGCIGFVGLAAPQIIKKIIGTDHRFFLPATCLTGSILLLFSDIISRMVVSPIILPIGAITSVIGAIIFIFILIKGIRKR